MNLRGIFILQS